MSAVFCKKQDIEIMNCSKNVLMKGLISFAEIYQVTDEFFVEFVNHP